jgi:hypothetical protein
MHALIPWAVAGVAGWLGPKVVKMNEDWQAAIVAALAGGVLGYVLTHL